MRDGWRKGLIFCGASICTVYCHTFAMIQMVFIYLLFLGAILVGTFLQMRLRIRYDSGGRSAEAIPTIYTFMDYCKEWFSALETPIAPVMFCGMGITLFLGYYGMNRMRRQKSYAPGLGVAAIGLSALTGALVSCYVNPCFQGSEPASFKERYDYEEALSFHYMYYDFVIYKLEHK